MELARELWTFLRARKKLWLAPILAIMLLFGLLIVLTQGTAVAPFIYSMFLGASLAHPRHIGVLP